MKLATREQIRKLDQLAAQSFGLSHTELIQTAGKRLAEKFQDIASRYDVDLSQKIAVWCGPGSNGEDGRVMARYLAASGFHVQIFEGVEWDLGNREILIDAYFGVGLDRDLSELLQQKIQTLNGANLKIFSIDLPSGLCANTGRIFKACLKASVTLTLYPAKPGLFVNEGPFHAGRIHTVNLHFPKELMQTAGLFDTALVDQNLAAMLLPPRRSTGNKTSFGHVLVVAGSDGMDGAASLACEAAARLGCGYVTLCSLSSKAYLKAKPDYLQLTVEDFLKSDLKKYQAVVFGPGLGTTEASWNMRQHLLKNHQRVLVDADGLNLLAQHKVRSLPPQWILTPHAGELSRLENIPAKDLEADRLKAVTEASARFGCVVILKGFRTVLASDSRRFILFSGNVALAKAGTGDVLSGFIGSLMAQGLLTAKAGLLGAYLHGKIADDWLRAGGSTRTLMASDLPERIDATLRGLKKPQ